MFVPVDFSTEKVVIITHYYEMIKIKIFDRALSELALQSSLKQHLREKLKKVDPHYFWILEEVSDFAEGAKMIPDQIHGN